MSCSARLPIAITRLSDCVVDSRGSALSCRRRHRYRATIGIDKLIDLVLRRYTALVPQESPLADFREDFIRALAWVAFMQRRPTPDPQRSLAHWRNACLDWCRDNGYRERCSAYALVAAAIVQRVAHTSPVYFPHVDLGLVVGGLCATPTAFWSDTLAGGLLEPTTKAGAARQPPPQRLDVMPGVIQGSLEILKHG
jgi:hypothetical protein